MNYKVNKIISKFENYEYVSFDLFDTLIKRDVSSPKKIFYIIENEYYKKYNKKIENFVNDRILAEKEAINKFENREPNIDEIYQCFKDYQKDDLEKLKEIEVNTEIDFCNINNLFFPIYEFCLKSKKKILITSDMYLNKKYIEKILKKCNISYDYLFLSNEEKCSKYTGELYKNILKKLNITSNQIIHIGDSKRADFINPRRFGIKSILIPKHVDNLRYFDKDKLDILDYNILNSFINNRIDPESDIYYRIGYETLGPLLYGYTKWLINSLKKNNIEKIFFLSREGNLLKKAFDLMNDDENIKSNYLYVSRRSVRVSLLKNVSSLEETKKVLRLKRDTNLKEFFELLGLDYNNYENLLKEFNYSVTDDISKISDFNKFFDKILNDVKNVNLEKEKNLIKYLNQEKFGGIIAVSDVGWVGTIQKSLQEVCKSDAFITGFYIGKSDKSNEMINDKELIKNFLFNDNSIYEYKMVHSFLNLFESFFLAQHGTTLGYEEKDNKIIPVLDEYEYQENEKRSFFNIQNGAIQFINDFIGSKINEYSNIDYKIAFKNILKLGSCPSSDDLKLFRNIDYVETTKLKFIDSKSLFYYIFHLKEMCKDFSNSRWKIGFLKSVFRININYYKLYSFLLKIDESKKEKIK